MEYILLVESAKDGDKEALVNLIIERKSEFYNPMQKHYWILRHRVLAAVILLMVLISGLNYDVFAFYGKKILGYDQITSGSFKELNELGRGQEINKSYKFKNGTEVIVDGVMFDKNKLSIMYRIKGESKEKIQDLSMPPSLNGMFKNYEVSNKAGSK